MQRQTVETFNLPVWSVLTIAGSADVTGSVFRNTHPGQAAVFVCALTGASTVVGPFIEDKIIEVHLETGQITSVVAERYDLASLIADLAAHKAKEFSGDGAPVDYTDGDPVATGEGTAEIGARYTDTTNGKLYLNGGTKAQPIWKLVTSAT